jgi:hypothetical protein
MTTITRKWWRGEEVEQSARSTKAGWFNSLYSCIYYWSHVEHGYRTFDRNVLTKKNRLMLFGETVAVYCVNRTEQIHCVGSPYLTGDTSRLRYRAPPVNAVWGNSRCLLCEDYEEEREVGSSERHSGWGGNRIYNRFWRFPGIARLSFWLIVSF